MIQLTHGCAMRTFYVIRKNFELRLCIDMRPGIQQQVAARLRRISTQSTCAYHDLAVKYRMRSAVHDALM